jgi:hypothetical protein
MAKVMVQTYQETLPQSRGPRHSQRGAKIASFDFLVCTPRGDHFQQVACFSGTALELGLKGCEHNILWQQCTA